MNCEVLLVRSSGDDVGELCGGLPLYVCGDCGSSLCAEHTEECIHCGGLFCASCLSPHEADHAKPVQGERGGKARKSA
jgi:hypothetical protein